MIVNTIDIEKEAAKYDEMFTPISVSRTVVPIIKINKVNKVVMKRNDRGATSFFCSFFEYIDLYSILIPYTKSDDRIMLVTKLFVITFARKIFPTFFQ